MRLQIVEKEGERNSMKDVIVRSLKTFLQAFVAAWLLTGNSLEKNALLGACAAGVAAVMNVVLAVKK
jgi:hypothetical protein